MKVEMKNEFPYILLISTALVALIMLDVNGYLRIALGLPFILFFPGYALVAALYPSKNLDGIGRLGLSFGLSITVILLMVFFLNYTPWGIRLYPMLMVILCFIAAMSVVAIVRREKLLAEQRFTLLINFSLPKWANLSGLDKVLLFILTVAVIFTVGSLSYVMAAPKTGEKFTEFYILGPQGKAEGYTREINNHLQFNVTMGVVNHEYLTIPYKAEMRMDGQLLKQLGPVEVGNGEKWEEKVTFTVMEEQKNQKVDFLLFKNDEITPYRSLQLRVNGNE